MLSRHQRTPGLLVILPALLVAAAACSAGSPVDRAKSLLSGSVDADSMGARPTAVRQIPMNEPADLVESSAAVMSETQPGVFFTINDSGNEAVLFALDTSGNFRGRWVVQGATNIDWEAASRGSCVPTAPNTPPTSTQCLFIADVGDNGASRRALVLYQVEEPIAKAGSPERALRADKVVFRYPDQPHDVESIYVGPDGTVYLLTKRRLEDAQGKLRPALVFSIPAVAWTTRDTAVATLLDSLPIVPGSSARRRLTDASLSPDARLLAVRTYGQIYVFATDTTTGRVRHSIPPTSCNIDKIKELAGEGVTWVGKTLQLLLTTEGRNAPIQIITCPLPER